MLWWVVVRAGAGALAFAPADHEPKPASYALLWSAPAGCPDADSVRKAVAELVPSSSGGSGVMSVEAHVTDTGSGFVLRLHTEHSGRHDVRRVESSACEDLAESTTLVVAIALDPTLVGSAVVPVPAVPTPPKTANPSPVRPSVASPAPSTGSAQTRADRQSQDAVSVPQTASPTPRVRRRLRPMHLALRLAPMGEFGALQRFGGGLNGAVGVLWPRLRLEGSATHLWPRRLEVSPGKGALAQIGVLALAACGRLRTGSLEFPLCAGVESGWVRAGSRGVEPGSVVHGPWLAPLARVGVSWSNTRVALWSAFTAAPPVVTTRFLVGPDAAEPVLPLSLRFSLGIEFFVSIQ